MQFGLLTINAIYIHQVETVQRRAARYVMNNFNSYASVSEMITTLGWPTLEQRRNISRTIMWYKIINNPVEVPTDDILFPSELQLRGHTKKILQYSVGSTCSCILFSHKRSSYGTIFHKN